MFFLTTIVGIMHRLLCRAVPFPWRDSGQDTEKCHGARLLRIISKRNTKPYLRFTRVFTGHLLRGILCTAVQNGRIT